MYLDNLLYLSNAQAVTVDAASESVIDQGAKADAYAGAWLTIQINVAWTTGTSAIFKLQTDSDEAFGTAVDVWTSASILAATLVAGYVVVKMRLPAGMKRYIRVYYDITDAFDATSKVDAFINLDVEKLLAV